MVFECGEWSTVCPFRIFSFASVLLFERTLGLGFRIPFGPGVRWWRKLNWRRVCFAGRKAGNFSEHSVLDLGVILFCCFIRLMGCGLISSMVQIVLWAVMYKVNEQIRDTIGRVPYTPMGSSVSIKSLLELLLPQNAVDKPIAREIKDFCLCCSALASSEGVESPSVYWIPKDLSLLARSVLGEFFFACIISTEHEMVAELMAEVLPELKAVVKETCIDPDNEEFVSRVVYPHLGTMCSLIMPCALTMLDHWSPEVKEQGMLALTHLGKNVIAAELGWYEEAILDACCRNLPASDELWPCVVEVSVLMLVCTQRKNPRSSWFDQILNEMLSHLERQPYNRQRRIAWLQHIEPVISAMGLVILMHFHRIFPLFFQWLHFEDDETVILVLERIHTILKLTWVSKSPFVERLLEELILLYKEVETRANREAIQRCTLDILILLRKCKGLQFELLWSKHKDDPQLEKLVSSLSSEALISQEITRNI
ncbi:hypothetical protein HPP92_018001 [Vanilla planifolia]|uniref:ARM repeat superfamily protein n=2 Tax=Vanilla planifolia TaxID=51239 RepID=A0A835QC56_VANPL|nr:hypothetical protein HPP92_018001 [Vanilla planifolia]